MAKFGTNGGNGALSAEEIAWLDREIERELAGVALPELPSASAEELTRRQATFDRILALREKIGPVGVSVEELIRRDRGWPEEDQQAHG
ncbi:MAG: hypothetical protein NTZ05_16285 [Chloroflexi bacterium]|nr:hypothetical protein [Chloroflexota bacterium]